MNTKPDQPVNYSEIVSIKIDVYEEKNHLGNLFQATAVGASIPVTRQLVCTLINPIFWSSSYITLLPLVISTTCSH